VIIGSHKLFRNVRASALAMLMISSVCAGEIRPEPGSESLDHLFASSDVVFRGEVKAVSRKESARGVWRGVPTILTTYVAEVLPDKVYKGLLASRANIRYVRPEEQLCFVSTCPRVTIGEFDYFFLKGPSNALVLTDPYFGKLQASRLTTNREGAGVEGLKDDILSGLADPDRGTRLIQIELVGSSGQKAYAGALRDILPDADDITRATVYYALLRLHDYGPVASMRSFLELSSRVTAIEKLRLLCLSQINAIDDPSAAHALGVLAKSPADEVREPAIHSLRTIASTASVPIFVEALDDRVQMIRYDAVLALAEVEKNWSLAPSVDSFQADEQKYISAWKAWWETEGKLKYQH